MNGIGFYEFSHQFFGTYLLKIRLLYIMLCYFLLITFVAFIRAGGISKAPALIRYNAVEMISEGSSSSG